MDIDRYDDITRSPDFKLYSFVSRGEKGNLQKIVKFSPFFTVPDTFNLALGTIRESVIDFNETSDNNDRDKILATVVYISQTFSQAYPDQKIFVRGRNAATTRLYRATINHSFAKLNNEFLIQGGKYIESGNEYIFELFVRNKPYDAFLFERRR